jgi:curli biogenesis system outer membrane secretion channel CsgG
MKIKLYSIILGIALLFAAPLSAQVKSVMVEGIGANENAAIKQALVQALISTKGASIQSSTTLSSDYKQVMTDVATAITASSSIEEDVKTATSGYISAYDLETSKKNSDGETVVKIKAYVLEYDPTNPNPGGRPRVVILPFYTKGAKLEAEGLNVLTLSDEIAMNLSAQLGEVGYFTIIEGNQLDDAIKNELNYSISADVDPTMQAKMGRLLSADYVVSGVITELATNKTKSNQTRAIFRGSMKVTDAATGARVGIDSVFNMAYIGLELKKFYRDNDALGGNPSTLCKLESTAFWGKHIKETLGPVEVFDVEKTGGKRGKPASWQFTLDNTSGCIKAGQIYDVFFASHKTSRKGDEYLKVDAEGELSIKVASVDGRQASAVLYLLPGEKMSDKWIVPALTKLSATASEKNATKFLVAKRRM